jgi:peptidoglycan/xylan/chitin deacetylase (PgdA/CDA1 family)
MRIRSVVAAVATAAAATLSVAVAVTPSQAAACNGYVALTYDDGPTGTTPQLLNALRSAGARATFFVQGNRIGSNTGNLRSIQSAGMWIGNHSWSHPHMTQLSQQQMTSEISQTQQAVQQVTGSSPRLFRPPYGETNSTLRTVQQQYNLREVLWDVDSQDWNGASTAQIVQAASRLQAGGVILMHEGNQNTIAAVPQIVSQLSARNLCTGMISPSTGRAVAPDGTTPTTPPTGNPTTPPPTGGGTCTATLSAGQQFGDRFNLNVAVSGATNWTVSLTLNGGQSVQNSWNASVSGTTGTVTARPNGSGNTFGVTIMANGNWTWPAAACRAG